MIERLQFPPAFGLMNARPLRMKVEVFLRLAGLEYRGIDQTVPMRAPKGKLPVLRDGAADPTKVRRRTDRRRHPDTLLAGLGPRTRHLPRSPFRSRADRRRSPSARA